MLGAREVGAQPRLGDEIVIDDHKRRHARIAGRLHLFAL